MYKEPSAIETTEKQEANENHEASRNVESPEELRQQMISESEKETNQFKKECLEGLTNSETRAEKNGLSIDSDDKEGLQNLNKEATTAREELTDELGEKEESKEKISTSEQLDALEKGREIILKLQKSGNDKSSEYWDLYSRLTEGFGENLKWIDASEIDSDNVEKMLDALKESSEKEAELKARSVETFLNKSKIADKNEALQRIIEYAGVSSEEELSSKLMERDEEGDYVINIHTPDILDTEKKPRLSLLKKIKDGADVFGYTYSNTPSYEFEVNDLIGRLRDEEKPEIALEVEKIFEKTRKDFEAEKDKSEFQKIDEDLIALSKDEEKYKEYIEKQKNLPPDAIIHLYHGLNKSGYDGALEVLNSPSHGIEQHSGPTVSLAPVGQFWQGVGFRYALRRDQIEFPGENNPNAVIKMEKNSLGEEGDGIIVHESGCLSLDQFEAEVMRSQYAKPNPDAEKELSEKLRQFSEERNAIRSL